MSCFSFHWHVLAPRCRPVTEAICFERLRGTCWDPLCPSIRHYYSYSRAMEMNVCYSKNLAEHFLVLTYDRAWKMFSTLLKHCNVGVCTHDYPFELMFKFFLSVIKRFVSISEVFCGFKVQVGTFNSGNLRTNQFLLVKLTVAQLYIDYQLYAPIIDVEYIYGFIWWGSASKVDDVTA